MWCAVVREKVRYHVHRRHYDIWHPIFFQFQQIQIPLSLNRAVQDRQAPLIIVVNKLIYFAVCYSLTGMMRFCAFSSTSTCASAIPLRIRSLPCSGVAALIRQ